MQCGKCHNLLDSDCKYLKCTVCSIVIHIKCLHGITETEYEFLKSNWKCDNCKNVKKGDETSVTPSRNPKSSETDFDSDSSQKSTGVNKKSLCGECKKGFSHNAHRAICCKCASVFHFRCLGITKEEYGKDGKNPVWECKECTEKGSGRPKGNVGNESERTDKQSVDRGGLKSNEDVTLSVLYQEMKSFRNEVTKTTKDITDNIAKHSDWVEELKNKLDDVAQQVKGFTEQLSFFKQENINLKAQLSKLSEKVNNFEQVARENIIEIQGVPAVKNENILGILSQIAIALSFDFDEKMIDNCYRMKPEDSSTRPGGIVVKFVRKIDMESFIKKRKVKRNLNSRDLGFMGGEASVIYINCSLTKEKRKLLNAARTARKEKHYTYLWVSNGRILMRKNPDDKAVLIQSQADIDKLD